MSKSKKDKPVPAKVSPKVSVAISEPRLGGWLSIRWIPWFLGIIAFLYYANSLGGEFVMDDAIVISSNQYTKQGIAGIPGIFKHDTFFGFFKKEGKANLVEGGRYRPLSLAMFAVEYQFFDGSPFMFHLIGVLLYAVCCILLFTWLRNLFKARFDENAATMIAFFAALLFVIHPVHTEVIANIKGRDEVLTLLFSLLAAISLDYADKQQSIKWYLSAAIAFMLALFSKENAIVFIVLIPLARFIFYGITLRQAAKDVMLLIAGTVPYFVLRFAILGLPHGGTQINELMNNPFLIWVGNHYEPASFMMKMATICVTFTDYLRLLVFPHPLTHDYYPLQIPLTTFANPKAILGLVLYGAGTVWSIWQIKKRNIIAFGILFYLIALFPMSNIPLPVGTLMSERFLFIPSIGFCLIIAYLISKYWLHLKFTSGMNTLLIIGILAFGIKTILRNPVWKSNYSIFLNDIKYSPNSAKLNNSVGGITIDSAVHVTDSLDRRSMLQFAETHLRKAIELHPTYSIDHVLLGNDLYYQGKYLSAIEMYTKAMQLDTTLPTLKNNIAMAYRDNGKHAGEKLGNTQLAIENLLKSYAINPNDAETLRLLGVANGYLNRPKEAIKYFELARAKTPKDANLIFDLGTAYIIAGDAKKGAELQAEAIKIDPKLQSRLKKPNQ